MKPFTDTIKRSNKENMNIKWKKRGLKRRRREKFKNSEISKRRPPIDKEKLMQ